MAPSGLAERSCRSSRGCSATRSRSRCSPAWPGRSRRWPPGTSGSWPPPVFCSCSGREGAGLGRRWRSRRRFSSGSARPSASGPSPRSCRAFPGLKLMFPLRYFVWFALAGAAIAAFELDRLERDLEDDRREILWPIAAIGALLAAHLRRLADPGGALGPSRGARGRAVSLRPARRVARGRPRRLRRDRRPRGAPPVLRRRAPDPRRRRRALRAGKTARRVVRRVRALRRDPSHPVPPVPAAPVPHRRRGPDVLPELQPDGGHRGRAHARPGGAARLRRVPGRDVRLRSGAVLQGDLEPRRAGARLPERAVPRVVSGARDAFAEVDAGLLGPRRNGLPERGRAPPRHGARPRARGPGAAVPRARSARSIGRERRWSRIPPARSARFPAENGAAEILDYAETANRVTFRVRTLRASSGARRDSRREPRERRRLARARRVRPEAPDLSRRRPVPRPARARGRAPHSPRLRRAGIPGGRSGLRGDAFAALLLAVRRFRARTAAARRNSTGTSPSRPA